MRERKDVVKEGFLEEVRIELALKEVGWGPRLEGRAWEEASGVSLQGCGSSYTYYGIFSILASGSGSPAAMYCATQEVLGLQGCSVLMTVCNFLGKRGDGSVWIV